MKTMRQISITLEVMFVDHMKSVEQACPLLCGSSRRRAVGNKKKPHVRL